MTITPENVRTKLVEQKEAIDLLETELRWILNITNTQDPAVNTPLANEMLQKFLSLHRDYLKIKDNSCQLSEAVDQLEIEDKTMEMIYRTAARILVRQCDDQFFQEFTSVVETGRIP